MKIIQKEMSKNTVTKVNSEVCDFIEWGIKNGHAKVMKIASVRLCLQAPFVIFDNFVF